VTDLEEAGTGLIRFDRPWLKPVWAISCPGATARPQNAVHRY